MSSQRNTSTNFSSLKKLLPPLPTASDPQTGDGTSTVCTADVQQKDIHMDPYPTSPARRSTLSAKPGKAKPITRPSTFRLSVELQEALRDVANYNQLNMTDIVAEGIWLHLQNFSWPAGSEPLRATLASMF